MGSHGPSGDSLLSTYQSKLCGSSVVFSISQVNSSQSREKDLTSGSLNVKFVTTHPRIKIQQPSAAPSQSIEPVPYGHEWGRLWLDALIFALLELWPSLQEM